jgi:hypothetical protein
MNAVLDVETLYRQLVIQEMQALVEIRKPLRLQFEPSSDIYFQVTTIAQQSGITPKEVIKLSVKTMFMALLEEANVRASTCG